jgi:hypothetical protein
MLGLLNTRRKQMSTNPDIHSRIAEMRLLKPKSTKVYMSMDNAKLMEAATEQNLISHILRGLKVEWQLLEIKLVYGNDYLEVG